MGVLTCKPEEVESILWLLKIQLISENRYRKIKGEGPEGARKGILNQNKMSELI